jgi:lipoate---protein ligase
MKWRVIPLQMHDAFMNMAIDEAISESVAKGNAPVMRFYKWFPSAVSIGYFQCLKDVVNLESCRSLGVHVVRRRTGGGAVYHSNSGEITYSVIAPAADFPKNIIESYKIVCGWVIDGLKEFGIQAQFAPINDIVVGGKKISGNAQTRRNNILLQHGTILHDVNVDKMFSVLNVPDEKMKDKIVKAVKERVTCVKAFSPVSKEATYEALLKGFTKGKDWEIAEISLAEMERAKDLSMSRYRTDDWNNMR